MITIYYDEHKWKSFGVVKYQVVEHPIDDDHLIVAELIYMEGKVPPVFVGDARAVTLSAEQTGKKRRVIHTKQLSSKLIYAIPLPKRTD